MSENLNIIIISYWWKLTRLKIISCCEPYVIDGLTKFYPTDFDTEAREFALWLMYKECMCVDLHMCSVYILYLSVLWSPLNTRCRPQKHAEHAKNFFICIRFNYTGVFVSFFIISGFGRSFGLLYAAFIETFGQSDSVTSLLVGVRSACAIVSGNADAEGWFGSYNSQSPSFKTIYKRRCQAKATNNDHPLSKCMLTEKKRNWWWSM